MDSKYKPGLISATLSKGKIKTSTNPLLDQLFSKKSENGLNNKKKSETGSSKKTKKSKSKEIKSSSNKTNDDSHLVSEKIKKPDKTQDLKPADKKKKSKKTNSKNLNVEIATISTVSNEKPKTIAGKRKKSDDHENTTELAPPLKKAKKSSSAQAGIKKSSSSSNDFPYVHESLLKKSPQTKKKKGKAEKNKDDEDEGLTRNKYHRDKTADVRTIFVGNCPLSTDKKVIKKLFAEYGAIESIRFRCGPVAKLEIPKRAAVIKKEFHEKAKSFVCFVVFKEVESAKKALEMNGHVLGGLHLRLDLAANFRKHDKKRSVFVGNLPFSVTEEDLRSHFEDCGDINNVRIVRDRLTSVGKGIAYVQFESKDGVTLAKKLNESEFEGRKLRVMTCTNKPKVEKPTDKSGKSKRPPTSPSPKAFSAGKRKIGFAPSNRKSLKSFHEMLQAKKDKRLSKMKKKKAISQKSDGLSSIFGDMAADMKKLKMENPKLRDKKVKDKKKLKLKEKRNKKQQSKKSG